MSILRCTIKNKYLLWGFFFPITSKIEHVLSQPLQNIISGTISFTSILLNVKLMNTDVESCIIGIQSSTLYYSTITYK